MAKYHNAGICHYMVHGLEYFTFYVQTQHPRSIGFYDLPVRDEPLGVPTFARLIIEVK